VCIRRLVWHGERDGRLRLFSQCRPYLIFVTTAQIAPKVKGAPKKKSSEASSKASTPTKDGENADNASADEAASKEVKEKQPSSKKRKVEKEPKTPKESKKGKAQEEEGGEPKLKRPACAYFLFCEAKRAEAREGDASKKVGAKELGEMWKELPEAEKEPYNTKAAALKAEYDEKKPPSETEKKKAAKADGPQKARSSYILYTLSARAQVLEEFPGIKQSEVMKLLGTRWKELSAEDKKVYEEQAKAEKEAIASGAAPAACSDKVEAAGTKRKATEDEDKDTTEEEAEASDKSATEEEKADQVEEGEDEKEDKEEAGEKAKEEVETSQAEEAEADQEMKDGEEAKADGE